MRVGLVLILFCVSGVQLQSPDDQLAVEDVESGLNRLQNDSHVERSELNTDQDSVQADVWAELRELRVILQFSQRQIEELKTENAAINNRLLASENRAEELQRLISDAPKVAFSFASGLNGYYGPFSSDVILVFNKQITNIGNAFSPVTGVFTAPVRGAYYFRFNIFGESRTHRLAVSLFKNQEKILDVSEDPNGSREYAVGGITLLLEKGDLAYVKLRSNGQISDNSDNHCTFSGFLLFPI